MDLIVHLSQLEHYQRQHPSPNSPEKVSGILLVPSHSVSTVEVDVSQIPKRYLRQALPALVEDQVAAPLDDLCLCPGTPVEGRLSVLVVRQSKLDEWIDSARIKGLEPSAIYPDFYLVPLGDACSLATAGEDYQLLRLGRHVGTSGSNAQIASLMKALNSGESSSEPVQTDLELKNINSSKINELNPISIFSLEQKTTVQRAGLPRAARVLLSLCCLLLCTLLVNLWSWNDYYQHQNNLLSQTLRKTYAALLPNSLSPNPTVNMRLLQSRLDDLSESRLSVLAQIEAASRLMAACSECYLEEFSTDANGFVISLRGTNYEPVVRAAENMKDLRLTRQYSSDGISTLAFSRTGAEQ